MSKKKCSERIKVIAKEKDRLDGEVVFSNCIVCIYL